MKKPFDIIALNIPIDYFIYIMPSLVLSRYISYIILDIFLFTWIIVVLRVECAYEFFQEKYESSITTHNVFP